MKREIVFYKDKNGECFVEDFLDSLAPPIAQKVTWVLSLIEDLDFIPKNYFKKLSGTDDIWECRIQFGSNSFRLLGFMYKDNFVVLTHGFVKKSNKVPKSEILKAEKYKQEYIKQRRYSNE